jgi:hypothetical protein
MGVILVSGALTWSRLTAATGTAVFLGSITAFSMRKRPGDHAANRSLICAIAQTDLIY